MGDLLVPYGPLETRCDYLVHVSVDNVYCFSHSEACRIVRQNPPLEPRTVRHPLTGEITAIGLCVPWRSIPGLVRRPVPAYLRQALPLTGSMQVRGKNAEEIAQWMCNQETEPVLDRGLQIHGVDLVTADGLWLQVKCDVPADRTGNLFIQTHERRL